ncbi:cysteine dioxygenase type I [Tamaricihabitans halophyticus]|uniref:Cysteine dioxygenase type I n=1 Tax=Tamaricihabitans halophyticus TaxID=1262583 RepID=A0A4V2STU2_9PSEU|nr:cysteine dioxygenase family protein [Tamaricihabitans halophyticus]TCP52046.1 cysteine dioxygenase type I [Tamaricihabitans halophyticus]
MFAVPPNTVALPAADTALRHPVRTALELAADRQRWAHLLRYDPERRYSALIERTATHEAWLLSWLPGQHTDLHEHGGATGAFTVVSGVLTERVFRAAAGGGSTESIELGVGQSRVFGLDYLHQVSNHGPDPAVSIHVYRPERPARFLPDRGL